MLGLQDVQLLTFYEQVRHGDWHGVHMLLKGINPDGHKFWQTLPKRLRVLQLVQLVCVIEHVAQSPLHGWANPLMLTYPTGVVAKHCPLKKTNPKLHLSQ